MTGKAWLSIIGVGEEGLDGLSPAARARIDAAEVLVGDARLLAFVPADGRECLTWPRPLTALRPDLEARRGRQVCVLASGDPMHFGIGDLLGRWFEAEEIDVLPHLSAFTLATARLGWSRSGVETVSLHAAPPEQIARFVAPGARIVALTRDGETPARVAELLRTRGWGKSRLWVLERLGGPAERVVSFVASEGAPGRFDDLNTLAILCEADEGTPCFPWSVGLPDEAFDHDGMMTKREVRAVTLSALVPLPGQLLWDVGAGCGSVALEWLLAAPRTQAIAIERDPQRVARIWTNALRLGVPSVRVIEGEAPQALASLEAPDAVFIGGGVTGAGVVETCWKALKPGGRLVANAVSLEGEQVLLSEQAQRGGSLIRLCVSHVIPLGEMSGWKPLMPVTQWSIVKP